MTWTCLEFVEVHGFKDADLGSSDVQAHLGGCPALSRYSIFKSQQLEDINSLPCIFAFPIGRDF